MTKQEWVEEIIAEGIVGAINRFKEEKPYALHGIATDTARKTARRLSSELGVVIKVDRELPKDYGYNDAVLNFAARGERLAMLRAGYVAVGPLIEEEE